MIPSRMYNITSHTQMGGHSLQCDRLAYMLHGFQISPMLIYAFLGASAASFRITGQDQVGNLRQVEKEKNPPSPTRQYNSAPDSNSRPAPGGINPDSTRPS